MMRALVLAALIACGGSPTAPPAPSGPPASLVATSTSADDVQVATVNGRPVWGSCVSAQAARGISKQAAIDECIGFELMAQEAERRDLAIDPETVHATRAALVSQLVAKEYEAKYNQPSELAPLWNKLVERNQLRFDHDEVRGSAYVRVSLPKTATPAEDAAARVIAEEIAAGVAGERGLMPAHLVTLAEAIAGSRAHVDSATVPPHLRAGNLDKAYAEALFAIPEVGRTSPAVRTAYGWDVILWSEVIPAVHPPKDELVKLMLPDVKRMFFSTWVNQIATNLGVKVKIEDKNLSLLENL